MSAGLVGRHGRPPRRCVDPAPRCSSQSLSTSTCSPAQARTLFRTTAAGREPHCPRASPYPVAAMRDRHVAGSVRAMAEKGLSPETMTNVHGLLSAVTTTAARLGYPAARRLRRLASSRETSGFGASRRALRRNGPRAAAVSVLDAGGRNGHRRGRTGCLRHPQQRRWRQRPPRGHRAGVRLLCRDRGRVRPDVAADLPETTDNVGRHDPDLQPQALHGRQQHQPRRRLQRGAAGCRLRAQWCDVDGVFYVAP